MTVTSPRYPTTVSPSPAEVASDEVAFWRGFIEWWVREREGPVPPKAWDALAAAEQEAAYAEDAPGWPVA